MPIDNRTTLFFILVYLKNLPLEMALKKKKVNRMGKKKTQQDEKAVKNKLESKKSEHNTEKIELINKNIFIETNKKQNQEIENIDSKLEMVSEKKNMMEN